MLRFRSVNLPHVFRSLAIHLGSKSFLFSIPKSLVTNVQTLKSVGRWSEEEKSLLMTIMPPLKQHHNLSWSAITNEFFPNRTVKSVSVYWTANYQALYRSGQLAFIQSSPSLAIRIENMIKNPTMIAHKPKRWTAAEDAKILSLGNTIVKKKGSWRGLEDQLPPNRSRDACAQRYSLLARRHRDGSGAVAHSFRIKQAWSETEDRLLQDIIISILNTRSYIPWEYVIPKFFPNRTRFSVESRYQDKFKNISVFTHTVHSSNKLIIDSFLAELNSKPTRIGRVWDAESDTKLRQGINEFGPKNFKSIVSKYFSITSTNKEGQTVVKFSKSMAQCRRRWNRILDPKLSRDSWSSAEHTKLQELVIEAYRRFDPTLDIDKIKRREATWPKDAKLSFAYIAKEMQASGFNRCSDRCVLEWQCHADPSLIPIGTPWTPEEIEIVRRIVASGESSVEAWRKTHRSVSECRALWCNTLSKEYDRGPLSQKEQVKFLLAIASLGESKYSKIREMVLPRRLSSTLSVYWKSAQIRLQQIVFDKFDADAETRLQCRGYNNKDFLLYLQSLQMTEDQAKAVIEEFDALKGLG